MGHIHQPPKLHQAKVQSRGPLHKVLANAELQAENQTLKIEPGPQDVSFDEHAIRIGAENL